MEMLVEKELADIVSRIIMNTRELEALPKPQETMEEWWEEWRTRADELLTERSVELLRMRLDELPMPLVHHDLPYSLQLELRLAKALRSRVYDADFQLQLTWGIEHLRGAVTDFVPQSPGAVEMRFRIEPEPVAPWMRSRFESASRRQGDLTAFWVPLGIVKTGEVVGRDMLSGLTFVRYQVNLRRLRVQMGNA